MNLPLCLILFFSCLTDATSGRNSTILNPILPGFYPDPSCIFVKELDKTFFCASSSFLTFPGIPITTSKDLQNWTLIGHAFSRRNQLPEFASPITEVGGIWAPTLRYNNGTFFLTTTLVLDYLPENDSSRWRNFVLTSTDPYNSASWSNPLHFEADGYDNSLFWDDDGQFYGIWAPLTEVRSGIFQSTIDLNTGNVGEMINIWNGTGGAAQEGPHVCKKDGFYYLIIAKGGTFLNRMVTNARAMSINGPYEANPDNPVLTTANLTEYFQAVGHADLFQDAGESWWGAAHAMRVNLQNRVFPMGRETVLFPVTWNQNMKIAGQDVAGTDAIDFTKIHLKPLHLVHWRYPNGSNFNFSPDDPSCGLKLLPSFGNLSSGVANASDESLSLLARRQSHSLFTFSVDLAFSLGSESDEAGVTVFVSEKTQIELGVVQMVPTGTSVTSSPAPHLRFQGASNGTLIESSSLIFPEEWRDQMLSLEIKAFNASYYAFSAGPAAYQSKLMTVAYAPVSLIRPIFTGKFRLPT
ncbi:Non-reducing end alpha-L-arabinofuranosidase BoGH43A [Colletotrichum gloeosporioides]|uniref:Non-reducing end alpha-L-arabinofuranosidase BoGH43A n=1 Tax=Colletotrichum gloeosporioides TaxID=474922 RepID=A0A8H4FMV5_COLGL|nr:Non-reducing end alpha-L-arabinofuranosidase BoGH43A [Colletotrichum gloeosporioides]KAF3806749.1 Non-reducing end alpha-L-arabinofuranosidase BoGH43A [Colletotrichum gloeosporioides]